MTLAKRWTNQDNFDASIRLAAQAYTVPVSLIKAIIGIESGFNPLAYNPNDPGGAWGLMQMIPSTARALGFLGTMADLQQNPHLAIDLGTKLLGQNLRRTGGAVADSVSAYNGGFRPALGYGAVRPNGTYANQGYVSLVLDAKQYFDAYEASKYPVTGPGSAPAPTGGGAGLDPTPFRVVDRVSHPLDIPPPARIRRPWWLRLLTWWRTR